jgi:hypothetical protein
VSIAVDGRLEMNGPTGNAVLAANGRTVRLSIDNVRTALKLATLHGQLRQMTGTEPRFGDQPWPTVDIEVHGWRVARMKRGRARPALPMPRRAP